MIHRNIKPANILVNAAGRDHLLDFGVAPLLDSGDEETRPLTDAGPTPQYAAPEQIECGEITVVTDIYALGALLYELLAGRGPWQLGGEAPLPTVLRRMLYEAPRRARWLRNGQPVRIACDVDAIVMEAMRREPGQRFSSVEAFAAHIRRFQACLPVEARAAAFGYRVRLYLRRNRWGAAAASLIIAAPVGRGVGVAWQARRAAAERDAAMVQTDRDLSGQPGNDTDVSRVSDRGRADSIARALIDSIASRRAASLDPDDVKSVAMIAVLSDLYILTENWPKGGICHARAMTSRTRRRNRPSFN